MIQKIEKLGLVPTLTAVFLAFLFALMGVWVRMMSGSFEIWQQAYLRVLIAGIIAAILFRKSFHWEFLRQIRGRDWVFYIVRGLFAYTLGVGFFTIAVQNAQLGTVSFVSSLPLLGLLAWIFFRERINPWTLPFIGVSVLGLVLLTGVDLRHFHLGWGETAAIIGMIGFDFGVLMSRRHPKQFSNQQNTIILLLTSWIPMFGISVAMGDPMINLSKVTLVGWTGLVMSSLMNVLVLYVINYVFTHLKAYVAGNILLLDGVFASVIGLMLYGEVPSPMVIVGAVVVLGCAYIISAVDARSDRLEVAPGAELA